MTKRLPSLNLLRVFEAAGRRLSFKLAAEELHISPPAVSHQIRAMRINWGKYDASRPFYRTNGLVKTDVVCRDDVLKKQEAENGRLV